MSAFTCNCCAHANVAKAQLQSLQQTLPANPESERRFDSCRQLLNATRSSFRACGLIRWGYSLVFSLDDEELNRGVSYVCKLTPWGRRHIYQCAGGYIDLTHSFLVLDLSLASAHHIAKVTRV